MARYVLNSFFLWFVIALMSCTATQSQCQSCTPQSPEASPRIAITNSQGKEIVVAVELACDPATRQQGLMYRKMLAEFGGMLFIFGQDDYLSFWMKNTYIPLDMIHISYDKKIVGIVENAKPHDETPRGVGKPARYVLEVNASFSKQHGLAPGDTIRFIDIPASCGRE
ncbi:MAG: DUF192 domain-containing protein [Myxococcales bacterium]|nr:DUF192 domain-containing protein [Myxococcales bacterium]